MERKLEGSSQKPKSHRPPHPDIRINDFIDQIEFALGPDLGGDTTSENVEKRMEHTLATMFHIVQTYDGDGLRIEEAEEHREFLSVLEARFGVFSQLEGTSKQRQAEILAAILRPTNNLLGDEIRLVVDATSSVLVGKPFSQLETGEQFGILAELRRASPVLDVDYKNLFPSFGLEPLVIDESEVRPDSIASEE